MGRIAIHVVGVDGIAAFQHSKLDPFLHDMANFRTGEIEPVLPGPTLESITDILLLEVPRIRTVRFVRAAAEVPDDFFPGRCRFAMVSVEV